MAEQKPAPNASMPSIHSFGTCLRKLRLYIEAKRPDESRQLARKFVSTIGLSEQVGDALFAFAGQAPLRSYAADSQIFVEGSPGQEVYLVLQGSVRIQRVGQGELERVEAGEFFGEFEALAQTNRSASAIAQTNVHTLRLPKPAIDQLSRFIPQIMQWFKSNMRERILAQLSQPNSLFEELNYEDRLSLLNALSFKSANQGDAIIEEGDPPSGLRIVYSGWLDVWRKGTDNVDRCVATLGPGDIFGESSLLLARQCNATVRCSTPVTYLELNPLSFYQAIPSVVGLREKLIALIHRRQQGYNPEGAIEPSMPSNGLNTGDLPLTPQMTPSGAGNGLPAAQSYEWRSDPNSAVFKTPSVQQSAVMGKAPSEGLAQSNSQITYSSDHLPRVQMTPAPASSGLPQSNSQVSYSSDRLQRVQMTPNPAGAQWIQSTPLPAQRTNGFQQAPMTPMPQNMGLPPQATPAVLQSGQMPQYIQQQPSQAGQMPQYMPQQMQQMQQMPQYIQQQPSQAGQMPQYIQQPMPQAQQMPQYPQQQILQSGQMPQYMPQQMQHSGQWPTYNPGLPSQSTPIPQYVQQPAPQSMITNMGLQALQFQMPQNAQMQQSGQWSVAQLSPMPPNTGYYAQVNAANGLPRSPSQVSETASGVESASSRTSFQGRVCPKCGFKDAGSICLACGAYLDDPE